jgi:hypothetical protein
VSWLRLYVWCITARWQCPSCGTPLRFDLSFRWLVAILTVLWGGFVFFAIHQHFHPRWYVIFFLGAALILRFDRISVAESSDKTERQHDLHKPPKDA